MTRERVVAADLPSWSRSRSGTRRAYASCLPSSSEAISLIADIFAYLHRCCRRSIPTTPRLDGRFFFTTGRARDLQLASPSRPRCSLIYDDSRTASCSSLAKSPVGVALGDGVAQLFAHRADIAAHASTSFAVGRPTAGHSAEKNAPATAALKRCHRSVMSIVVPSNSPTAGTGVDAIGRLVGSADDSVVRLPAAHAACGRCLYVEVGARAGNHPLTFFEGGTGIRYCASLKIFVGNKSSRLW